jgi:hypothetical protein
MAIKVDGAILWIMEKSLINKRPVGWDGMKWNPSRIYRPKLGFRYASSQPTKPIMPPMLVTLSY